MAFFEDQSWIKGFFLLTDYLIPRMRPDMAREEDGWIWDTVVATAAVLAKVGLSQRSKDIGRSIRRSILALAILVVTDSKKDILGPAKYALTAHGAGRERLQLTSSIGCDYFWFPSCETIKRGIIRGYSSDMCAAIRCLATTLSYYQVPAT